MPNESILITKTFHFSSILFLTMLIIWDRIINIPKFPYCFFYLTQIDLYLNALYYLLSLINDFTFPKSKSLDCYFNFCFCLSFCVFMMFWGLFFANRSTLFKKGIELSYTLVLLLHGGVFFIDLCEQLYSNPRRKPLYLHKSVYCIFSISYCLFLRIIYNLFGIKVYPFVYGALYLLIIICIVGCLVTLIGHYIYYLISNRSKSSDIKENNSNEMEEAIKIDNQLAIKNII